MKRPRAQCDTCGAQVALHTNGQLYAHTNRDRASFGAQFGGGHRLVSTPCHGKAIPASEQDGAAS